MIHHGEQRDLAGLYGPLCGLRNWSEEMTDIFGHCQASDFMEEKYCYSHSFTERRMTQVPNLCAFVAKIA